MAIAARDAPPSPSPISVSEWERVEVPEAYRAEIIRGELVVSPMPAIPHQYAITELIVLFKSMLPSGLIVAVNVEWRTVEDKVVASAPGPDLVVIPPSRATHVTDPPVLAVEVGSPSDRQRLLSGATRVEGKRLDFAVNGLSDYLEVDIYGTPATITRYEAVDGRLEPVEVVRGDQVLAAERPFPYSLRPVDLVLDV